MGESRLVKSVLITGGAGYLGKHLAKELLSRGEYDRICIYSRSEHTQAAMRSEMPDERLRWFIGDVRDKERLTRAMRGCQLVIHAAALKRIELAQYCPDELVKTNVIGSMNVVESAALAGVEKALLISSDKAYLPVSAYGQTKALAESLFLTANTVYPHGPRYAVVRYGNVWRSTGSVVNIWEKQFRNEETVMITDPKCTRFFMTIKQAVELVLDTARDMQGGELEIPNLPAYELGDLFAAMARPVDRISCQEQGLPSWEKLHESMDADHCSETARRMSVAELMAALGGR